MERDRTGNGFNIVLHQAPDRTVDFFGRFLLGLAILLTIYGCAWNGLNLSGGVYSRAILTVVGALFCLVGCGLPRKWRTAHYVAMILLAVYAVAASRWIVDGWNITVNQVFAGLEVHLGRIFPRYAVEASENLRPLCATLFMAIPTAILGLAAGWSANGRLAVLLTFDGIVLGAAIFGLYTPDAWTVLLILATAVTFGRRVTYRNNFSDRGGMALWLLAIMALLMALSLLPGLLTGDGTAGAETRRRGAGRQIYRLRYEQTKQVLPGGDFSGLGDFSPEEDKIVLTLTMAQPTAVYLRGFVGERYVGDGWTGLPAAKKAESAIGFSWLHDRGFYGQNQIAQVADVLNMESQIAEVGVDNETAGTGHVYAPYELKTGEPDAAQIGDADLPADGLRGQKQYDYYVTDRSVTDYEELYTRLSEAWRQGDEAAMTYLKSENVYREYVYANYLDVPPAAAESIRGLLGGQKIPEGGLSFSAAQKAVQDFLSAALAYNETPPAYKGGDFLTFLLDKSRQGYSVHYATAAALLFRSLGVPARYVEGYYIPAEEAAAAREKGGPVKVTEADAHAWVEIYRDGVGFIPFEVMPSSVSSSNQSEQNQNNAGGAAEEEETPPEPINILAILLWLLILLLLLLVLAFITLELRRLWLRGRWKRLLAGCTPEQAVELWTVYIVRLLDCMGVPYRNGSLYRLKDAIMGTLGRETAEGFVDVVAIQQQARFSLLPVNDGQYGAVHGFADGMVRELKEYCKWPVRLRLRYLDCII